MTTEEAKKRAVARAAAWKKRNPDKVRAYHQRKKNDPEYRARREENRKRWRREHPDRALNHHLSRYNITVADYLALLKQQSGVCAICQKPPATAKRLDVDHDHETGRVRGLLCENCNRGLGQFGDDHARILAAANYLAAAAARQ